MGSWISPNVLSHVSGSEERRIGNLIKYISFNNKSEAYPGYKNVTKGDRTVVNVPDISADDLFTRVDELQYYSDNIEFRNEDNYRSAPIASKRYQNPLLYQLVLLLNKNSTNADFTIIKNKIMRLISSNRVDNLLFKIDRSSSISTKELKNAAEINLVEENFENNVLKTEETINEYLNNNMPTTEFDSDFTKTPMYKQAKNYVGSPEKLIDLVAKLNRYQRVKE